MFFLNELYCTSWLNCLKSVRKRKESYLELKEAQFKIYEWLGWEQNVGSTRMDKISKKPH